MTTWPVVSVVIALCSVLSLLLLRFRRQNLAALREPLLVYGNNAHLLDSDEHDYSSSLLFRPRQYRLEVAVREAEIGYNKCPICGFENFKRVSCCVACGRGLHPSDSAKTQLLVDGHHSVHIDLSTSDAVTSRERRAKKRTQWTRQVNANGQFVWHFTCVDAGPSCDSFTIHFQLPTGAMPAPDSDPLQLMTASDSKKLVDKASFTMTTRDEIIRQVRLVANGVSMQVATTRIGDKAGFPLSHTLNETTIKADSATLASFPTRYADFVVKVAMLLMPSKKHGFTLHVTRADLWEESIETLSALKPHSVRWTMRIDFINEIGIDAGGLAREWFVLMNEAMVDPANGVFQCVNNSDQSYYLNRHSAKQIGQDHLLYFLGAGRLIGRALLEGSSLGFHLSLPLLKIVLGVPVSLDDLEFYDRELYRSMLWIKENDGVGQLGLDFSVTEQIGDELVIVDLIPNGRNVNVDDGNKAEFLERKLQYLLFESVSSQLYMFLKGLYEVVPQHLLVPFDVEELDYLLCGSDEIDVDDWERNTKSIPYDLVQHPDHSEDIHPTCRWFWELVPEMPNEYRRRLLQFATGLSRAPLAGFSALTSYNGTLCPFTLKEMPLVGDGFITSHACFNRLEIPLHSSRDELKRVLYAILDTEVYGFTMD